MRRREGDSGRRSGVTGQISVSVAIDESDVRLVRRDSFVSVSMPDEVRGGVPGTPDLPRRKYYILVPAGAAATEVEAGNIEASMLAERVTVQPVQRNVPALIGTEAAWTPPDPAIYEAKQVWPEQVAAVSGTRRMGGFTMVEVEVCPFRYHLPEQRLELVRHVTLTLGYRAPEPRRQLPPEAAPALERKIAARVRTMVLNPEDLAQHGLWRDLDKAMPFWPPFPHLLLAVDYVIVTSQALAGEFERLADWRRQFGLRAKVVTVEDIINSSVPDTGNMAFWHLPTAPDGGTRDPAEAVRNFAKWACAVWLTEYLLLGGDTSAVPYREAVHQDSSRAWYLDVNTPDLTVRLGYAAAASSATSGTAAANVLDNDSATAWECASGDAAPWVRLTLAPHTPLNCVVLDWGATHAASYTIEVSDDSVSWVTVHTASAAPGGTEQVNVPCTSAGYARLRINSGTGFSLRELRVYGPERGSLGWGGGRAYSMGPTVTRIYLGTHYGDFDGQPPLPAGEGIVIASGPLAGTLLPHDPAASDTSPGWYFMEDLLATPSVQSASPTRFAEIRGPAQYHGQEFFLKHWFNSIAADLYFGDVAASDYLAGELHDWDADGNEVYGELYASGIDGVNGFADLCVGRASVETTSEAAVFIDKVIRYETFVDTAGVPLPDTFATSALLVASNLYGPSPVLDISAQTKEDVRHTLLASGADWQVTRLYQDAADVPPADQDPYLGPLDHTALMAAIGAGHNLVALNGHGWHGGLCTLGSGDASGVTNAPGIFYANSCLTNRFDIADTKAFGELALLNPHGGAVAYIGSTRYSWAGDGPIEKKFVESIIAGKRLGEAFTACTAVGGTWGRYSLNLLGDPAMPVWSARPRSLEVVHATTTHSGSQLFHVHVNHAGRAAADVLVCLSIPGTMLATARTSMAGMASLSVSLPENTVLTVTASKTNHIPYVGKCAVLPIQGCRPIVTCHPAIGCGTLISCQPSITCTALLACQQIISCGPAIACTELLQCGKLICPGGIGICPQLRPDERRVFEGIYELLGVRTMDELVERADWPEVARKLELLPDEVRRPLLMMIRRIQRERSAE